MELTCKHVENREGHDWPRGALVGWVQVGPRLGGEKWKMEREKEWGLSYLGCRFGLAKGGVPGK